MKKRLQTVLVPYWGEINADGTISYGYERRFELIEEEEEMKKFTKSDLREGDVVMYANGQMRFVKQDLLLDEERFNSNGLIFYDEELRHNSNETLNIVEVFRSIWKREEPKITTDEKIILRNIDSNYKYIARAENGVLIICQEKPRKCENYRWESYHCLSMYMFSHLFKMVQWTDDEPWKIEDLLNLPEKEEQNEN